MIYILIAFQLFIIQTQSIIIKDKKDCSNKITPLTQFEYGTEGYLSFKLLDNDLRELTLSSIAICKNNKERYHLHCEEIQKDCITHDLYNLYQQNIELKMNITESGFYEIFILHCSRNTNIQLSYQIHMKNDIYELSMVDIKEYKSNFLLFYILLIVIIIQIVIFFFKWKQVKIIHIGIFLSSSMFLISILLSICYFIRSNNLGEYFETFHHLELIINFITDVILMITLALVSKGLGILFNKLAFHHIHWLFGGIAFTSLFLILQFTIDGVFGLFASISSFVFIIPQLYKTLKFNKKVIQFHILYSPTTSITEQKVLDFKMIVLKLVFILFVIINVLLFINTLIFIFITFDLKIYFVITNQYIKTIFIAILSIILFPCEQISIPIENDIDSIQLRLLNQLNPIDSLELSEHIKQSNQLSMVREYYNEIIHSNQIFFFQYVHSLEELQNMSSSLHLDGILLHDELQLLTN